MVIQAVHIVLSIFLMIGLGMLLTKIGWLNDGNAPLLSNLVVKVGLPAMIISNLFTSYTRESLAASAAGIVAPFVSLALTALLGKGVCRFIRMPEGRRGVFNCMFTFSNSVFIGLPVSTALFGDQVVPYALLYYIANTVLFWTWGVSQLRRDGGRQERGSWRALPGYLRALAAHRKGGPDPSKLEQYRPARLKLQGIRRVCSLPLCTFLACVLLVLAGVKPPKFVMDAAKYVGALVTPLSMLFTGVVIMRMLRQGNVHWQKGYAMVLLGRFVAAPLLLLATSLVVPMPGLMRNALLIQASMPVMGQTPIVAGSMGSDAEYGAGGIALSTLLSLVFIPLYMGLIPFLGA